MADQYSNTTKLDEIETKKKKQKITTKCKHVSFKVYKFKFF